MTTENFENMLIGFYNTLQGDASLALAQNANFIDVNTAEEILDESEKRIELLKRLDEIKLKENNSELEQDFLKRERLKIIFLWNIFLIGWNKNLNNSENYLDDEELKKLKYDWFLFLSKNKNVLL